MDPEPFLELCQAEACACQDLPQCLCPVLAAYGRECARDGAELTWRNQSFCRELWGGMDGMGRMEWDRMDGMRWDRERWSGTEELGSGGWIRMDVMGWMGQNRTDRMGGVG